jgi:PKD repeat protein
MPWNGWNETDFRTVEEPIAGLMAYNDSPTALGHATTLTATITAGSNVTYTWALGDGTGGSGAVLTHIYPATGTYTAVVTAVNSVSELTATTTVTVEKAIIEVNAYNDSPTMLGNATTLTATTAITPGTNVTYTWALGDDTWGSGAVLTHTYPAVGIYTALVTATTPVGELTATTTVMIVDEPIVELVAYNDSPTVLGNATTLTATITAGSNLTYTWAFGDGTWSSGAVLTHTYPAVGSYVAVVTATNSVSVLTATTTVIVEEPITGLVAYNDSPTLLGNATALTATITVGSNVTYTWALGDGMWGNGAVLTHTYPATGNYTAVVTATNPVSVLTATTRVTVMQYTHYLPLISATLP